MSSDRVDRSGFVWADNAYDEWLAHDWVSASGFDGSVNVQGAQVNLAENVDGILWQQMRRRSADLVRDLETCRDELIAQRTVVPEAPAQPAEDSPSAASAASDNARKAG